MIINPGKNIVGFDIDDVIFHLGEKLIFCYNKEYGTKKTLEDVWNLGGSEKVYFVIEKYRLYENMEATSILPMLKEKRRDIFLILITSREEIYRDITMEMFKRHNAGYDKLFMGEKKSEVCHQEGVGDFFDDSLYNIIDVDNNAPKTKTHLVKRPRNGANEIIRLENNGIVCDRQIERLTEQEIIKLFGN